MINKKFFIGTATLIGTIVGAGIFGIPYVISKSGFILGSALILLVGIVVLITHLCYGEVILRTNNIYQMAGYAEKYLGKIGKFLTSFSLIAGIYGAMLAYIVGCGKFLETLFADNVGGSSFFYGLISFIFVAIAVLIGLRVIAGIELIFVCILIIVLVIFFTVGFSYIKTDNFLTSDYKYFLLPFGVLLFAFTGGSAIPQVREVLNGEEKTFKKSIFWGTILPIIIYFLFAFITVGITGNNTTDDAMSGLGNILGKWVLIIGACFGFLSIITTFLTLSLALRDIYVQDYKINKAFSFILTFFVPLILFLSGATDFVKILEIVGGLTIGPTGILLLLMHLRAKEKGERKPEFQIKIPTIILYFIIWVYILGMVYVAADLLRVV